MSVPLALLGLLERGPSHGYDLKRDYDCCLAPGAARRWFPVLGLDGLERCRSGELVMDLLTAAVRERGTTVVLVTHDARVAAYADREVVVRDGKVGTLPEPEP